MKLRSLLLTAAAVAFTAGQASALEITSFVAPNGTATTVLAQELDLANSPVSGTFSFDLTLTNPGQFPAGDNLLVEVMLPAGITFAAGVNGNSVNAGNDSAGPVFGGASLQGGGGTGDENVTFLVTIDPDATNIDDAIGFTLPLQVSECPTAAAPLVVTAVLAGSPNIAIEGDVDGARSTGLVSCETVKTGIVASDEDTNDTQILLPDYIILGQTDGSGFNGAAGILGSVNYTLTSLPTTPDIDLLGTDFGAQDIAAIVFDIAFDNSIGFTAVSVGGIPATQLAGSDTFRVTATSAADIATLTDGVADDVIVFVDGVTELIGTNTVEIRNATCTFDDTRADFIPSIEGASGDLDALEREGQVFGFFDWNQEDTSVNTVYRVTGLSTTEDTPLTINFENSNTGQNGSFTTVVSAADVNNGEYIISSRALIADVNPGYGRADVQFNFETQNLLDVDRLIASDGIVTDYGDAANLAIFNQVVGGNNGTDSDNFPNDNE